MGIGAMGFSNDGIFGIATLMVLLSIILDGSVCLADKLSPDQKAPPSAQGSGGLILKAPYQGAADVGQRRANPAPPAAASPARSSPAIPQVDGVVREETEELKEVDGQLVRVVKGNFGYDSPEGLPIAVKYVADENGNRASFMFGTAVGGGGTGGNNRKSVAGGSPSKGPSSPGNKNGSGSGAGSGGANRPSGNGSPAGGASTYLPPTTKVDRSYLPPN